MAQGMPHPIRKTNPFAFEDEATERVRLGIGNSTNEPAASAGWTTRAAVLAVVIVTAVAVVLLVLLGIL